MSTESLIEPTMLDHSGIYTSHIFLLTNTGLHTGFQLGWLDLYMTYGNLSP